MDAGQLFEQLQKKSQQNPNDIAVVLDAMITTILEKVNSDKEIEFADFGHFKKSIYGKLDFEVSDGFAKIVNFKYDDMEPVQLSESDKTLLTNGETSTDEIAIDDSDNDEITPVSLDAPSSDIDESATVISEMDLETDLSFEDNIAAIGETQFSDDDSEKEEKILLSGADEPLSVVEETSEFQVDIEKIDSGSAIEESSTGHIEEEQSSVSSYVTEILDDIQTQKSVDEPETQPIAEFPSVKNIRKLETVIVEESLNEDIKETPMQSYSSGNYQEPKQQEYPSDGGYGNGGLSNSDLGGEGGDAKRWIIMIGIAIVGIGIGIAIFFHFDTKEPAKSVVKVDSTLSKPTVDSTQLAANQQPEVQKPVDTKTKDSKSKTATKDSKSKVKDSKTATKDVKSTKTPAVKEPAKGTASKTSTKKTEPSVTSDATGKVTIDYASFNGISGLSGTYSESKGGFVITVSSWSKKTQAEREQKRWDSAGLMASIKEVYLVDKGGYWYRVRVGQFKTRKEAMTSANDVKGQLPDAYVDTVE